MRMRIVRKKYAHWFNGMSMIIPPIFMYFMSKVVFNTTMVHEWLWWVFIPVMITAWLFIFQIRITVGDSNELSQ